MFHVLVVEDDNAIAMMYRLKLNLSGYEVTCANDGMAGLTLAETLVPDLILLDIQMPRMCGDEMLEVLRSKDWAKNIRVIILTNYSKSEAPSRLQFLQVDRYIVKAHLTPAEVVKVVDEVLTLPT